MTWASVAVGLGGVSVALLTLMLTYRSRFGPYQQKLYERQLDAVTEVLQSLGRYHDEGLEVVDRRADRQAMLLDAKSDFFRTYRRWNVVIPQPMTEAVTSYLRTIEGLVVRPAADRPRDGGEQLARAYASVLGAAQRELRVKTLSDRTLSSIEALSARSADGPALDTDPLYIKVIAEQRLFDDFADEGHRAGGSASPPVPTDGVNVARRRIYADNRNLFLTHAWRPSRQPNQLVDIAIRVIEHHRRGNRNRDQRSGGDAPLTDGLVERVEYYLGPSFGRAYVKSDAATGFRLDISAFGPTLCVATVYFTDGKPPVRLHRYLDFLLPDGAGAVTKGADAGAAQAPAGG